MEIFYFDLHLLVYIYIYIIYIYFEDCNYRFYNRISYLTIHNFDTVVDILRILAVFLYARTPDEVAKLMIINSGNNNIIVPI